MPRKPLIRSDVHPYHVSARCNNKEKFYCGNESSWAIFCYHLNEICELFEVRVHAFVMMPNHFHLIITTPAQDLGIVMHKFMLSVTKTMNSKSGRTGRVFGARYHWSLVKSLNHFDCVQKYVYRNPVKAKIVNFVEDYPFSSLRNLIQTEKNFIKTSPIVGEVSLIPAGKKKEFLMWLNQPFGNEEYYSIRKGLNKTTFVPVKIVP